jgi:hypothetical protein
VLIGLSCILLGEHWVNNVIGRYIIGSFWLLNRILLYQLVLHRRSRGTEGEQAGTVLVRG